MDTITDSRVRSLSPEQLGLQVITPEAKPAVAALSLPSIDSDDPILTEVSAALAMGFAGVILSGPPGTGKSWYARGVAERLAEDADAIRTIQFHASYQYEDFMEGYVATETGGFTLVPKIFAALCDDAQERPLATHVLVIDEISRSDVTRVLGEALTYLEPDKRDIPVTLASGSTLVVPKNIVVIATMNPWDKGVDELDIALERRFAQIDILPSASSLRKILTGQKVDPGLIDRLIAFFEGVQALDDELCHLGHAYFLKCVDEESTRRNWNFRLFPFFKRACRLDIDNLAAIKRMWLKVVPSDAASVPVEPPASSQNENPAVPAA